MKKFSANNIGNFEVLNKSIVGFEFEFYAEKPYYKLLEYLNNELEGIKVKGYRKYHSKFNPTDKIFKIEPDYSLGNQGVEVITGPIPYVNAKVILLKILKIIQEFGRTNEKCSIHINISFDPDETPKTIDLVNQLKIILDINEDYIYKLFPERKDSYYAKSVKRIIPFKGYDFSTSAINHITNNLELPNTKYYGINTKVITEGRIEFRYIGGKDYQHKSNEILELLNYFIITTWNSINENLDENNIKELQEYLNDNVSNYKKFKTAEDFIAEFPSIKLQVDKNSELNYIRIYYDLFYDKLFDLVNNIYNLQDCIINWNNESKKIELVDADFKSIFDLKYVDFINCNINGGTIYKSNIINCEIKNSHLYTSSIINSQAFNSKIEACKIDSSSEITNCYLFNTFLDGTMDGGVFRSGRIGQFAVIGDDVEIITRVDSYFGIEQTDDDKKLKGSEIDKKDWMKK
jgi:hypothetical protein